MKATISATGTLCITPESGIEAYAMSHWGARNLEGKFINLIVDLSNFPSMLMKHASDCAMHNEPAKPNGPCDCGVSTCS